MDTNGFFGEYNVLRNNLIEAFKHKFSYEIKSNIYNVASLLNISKLKLWYNRKDCLIIRQSAHLNLIQVRNLFDKKKEIQEQNTQTSNIESVNQLIVMIHSQDFYVMITIKKIQR